MPELYSASNLARCPCVIHSFVEPGLVNCLLLWSDMYGAIHIVLWERQHELGRPTLSFSVMFSTRVPLGLQWKLWKGSLSS